MPFNPFKSFFRWVRRRKGRVLTVALLGVDNAGKSTVLARLTGEFQEFVAPTVGFASEVIKQGKRTIKVFDLGGGANIRGIWPRYYAELHGAIYVIDSSDRSRLPVAREVLHQALEHARFANKPLLIMANKQDKSEPMTSDEIATSLGLEKFQGLQYNIVTCSALITDSSIPPDPRILQGLKWLTTTIDSVYASLQKRIYDDCEEQKEEERIEREEKRKRIEARRRERELEQEKQETNTQSKDTEVQTITTTPEQKPPSTNVSTPGKLFTPRGTDLFDKGRDMFTSTDAEINSARSKQKTPRGSVYSSTTILIKPEEGAITVEEHKEAPTQAEDSISPLPKFEKPLSTLPPLQRRDSSASPSLASLHPLPPLDKPSSL